MRKVLTVRLKGGLGNQMFQYAAGQALAMRSDALLKLDTTSGFIRDRVYQRSFSLGTFPIKAIIASFVDQLPFWFEQVLAKYRRSNLTSVQPRPWGNYLREAQPRFMTEIGHYRVEKPTCMEGYWQCEKYFEDFSDVIYRELSPPAPSEANYISMTRQIESCESVAVGVRVFEDVPGSDNKAGVGGLTPMSFYEDAARRLGNHVLNPNFFVFCTAAAAVKNKLSLPGPTHYLTHDDGYHSAVKTLWLISKCKYHIISNSSFYWWGAWLAEYQNPGNLIIAADMFTNRDTIPERWTVLDICRKFD